MFELWLSMHLVRYNSRLCNISEQDSLSETLFILLMDFILLILSMSAVSFFFYCCGWEPLYGSSFVFTDVASLYSKMECLSCQGANPAGQDHVTTGMKMLCLYHHQAKELHSGVAYPF